MYPEVKTAAELYKQGSLLKSRKYRLLKQ